MRINNHHLILTNIHKKALLIANSHLLTKTNRYLILSLDVPLRVALSAISFLPYKDKKGCRCYRFYVVILEKVQ